MSPLPYEVPHHGDEDMNKQVGLTPHYYFIPTVYITRCVLACLVEVLTTRLSRIIQSVHGGGDEHKKMHTGEKPFKCDFCEYSSNKSRCWHEHIEE